MKKQRTRMISLLAAAVLLFACCVPAFAADEVSAKPSFLIKDGSGLLMADMYNKVIWREEDGSTALYAGRILEPDMTGTPAGAYLDGASDEACFVQPWAIAPYLDGYVVSDTGANALRFISPEKVSTAAGAGKAGCWDGIGASVFFSGPTGLATDAKGRVYVADTGNGRIRCLNTNGYVGTYIYNLSEPTGLCFGPDGALYVAETGRSRILRIESGTVEVLAGKSEEEDGEYIGGFVNGSYADTMFDHPQGVAVAEDGTVYVADTDNRAVRMLRDGVSYTLANENDGLVQPNSILLKDGKLYVTDRFTGRVTVLPADAEPFADTAEDAWYASYLTEARRSGIVNGVGDNCFVPDRETSRAEFVTMLSRLNAFFDGSEVIDGDAEYADVPEDAWFAPYVRWADASGLVQGSEGMFMPNDTITMEQMLLILYRYAGEMGLDTTARAETDPWADQPASDYAAEAVSWAAAVGLADWAADTGAAPRQPMNRAQVTVMLVEFLEFCR